MRFRLAAGEPRRFDGIVDAVRAIAQENGIPMKYTTAAPCILKCIGGQKRTVYGYEWSFAKARRELREHVPATPAGLRV